MGVFEYISVLTSIVIGLALAHLLRGVAELVQHPDRKEVYWVHLLWVVFMLLQTVLWWWWQFALESVTEWTLQVYFFLLLYAFILYLLCALLFPSDLEGYAGYEDYLISRRGWFFGLLAAFFIVDLVDTWLKGVEHFLSLGPLYPIQNGLYALGSVVAAFSTRRAYHGAFALVAVSYLVVWAFRAHNNIG